MKGYYEPREDSFLLLENIKKYSKGSVLDLGTGSGILAIEAAKYANKVLAVDINRAALKVAKDNAKKQGIKNIGFKHSDLFSSVRGKFDLIVFNPPYLPRDRRVKEDKDIEGGKRGYETIERFLSKANDHLKRYGKILLLFSSLTDKQKVDEVIAKNLFKAKQLTQKRIFFETLYVYLIEKSKILIRLDKVSNIGLYAKGKRGLIYSCIYKNKKVAVKIKNPKSKAVGRIKNEAKFLEIVNKKKIGPKLLDFGDDYIVMEFVEGKFILDFFEKSKKKQIITVIKHVFEQLFVLDRLGINKEEMHHPVKHIIVTKNNKSILIDFERAKKSKKTHNITQFCQFLIGDKVREILEKEEIRINRGKIIRAAKDYSKNQNKKQLDKIGSWIG